MAINVLEEAGRVEVACDGCGRVVHTLSVEEHEGGEYTTPLKRIGDFNYCELCQSNHEKRVEEESNSYEAKHLRLRETITDAEELEQALKELDTEHGVNRES
jgi:hypothetical protein